MKTKTIRRLIVVPAIIALNFWLQSASAVGNALSDFKAEEPYAPQKINLSRLLVRMEGRPYLLFGPFIAEGPYSASTYASLPNVRGEHYVIFFRGNFYLGKSKIENFPDDKIVLLTDKNGEQFYCASGVLKGKKNTYCGEFFGPDPKDTMANESILNVKSTEPVFPLKLLPESRLLISDGKRFSPERLIWGPFRTEGPYRYHKIPTVTYPGGNTRLVMVKNHLWVLQNKLPEFLDENVYFLHDKVGSGFLCAEDVIEVRKGAVCVQLANEVSYIKSQPSTP